MGAERWLCSSCGATSNPAPEPPPSCAGCDAPLHVGKYGLIELLSSDQSIYVVRGRESSGPRQVTVRILPENLGPAFPALRQALKKFSSFTHPAIAKPLDAGVHQNHAYLVEEYAPGEPVTRADMTLRESMVVMRDVSLAIAAAHDQGIVHPDLRADHIRVFRGPGKSLGESGWRVSVTGFVGPGEGNFRANLKALGTILCTVATGRAPGSAPVAVLNPLVDTALESIIRMALDTEGSHQPPGAEEIATELTRWLKGDAPSYRPQTRIIPPPPPLSPAQKQSFDWSRIRPEARIAAGVILALGALILFLTLRSGGPAPAAMPSPDEQLVVFAKPAPPPEPKPKPVEPPPSVAKPEPAKEGSPSVANPQPAKEGPKPPPKPIEAPKPPPVDPPPAKPEPVKEPPKPAPPPEPKPKPVEPPKPAPPPPPPPPPAKEVPRRPVARSIGAIQAIHPEYGLFVKLEGNAPPAAGEELEAVRDDKVIARLSVERITSPEKRYPKGCAVCTVVSGSVTAGDAVRRIAK